MNSIETLRDGLKDRFPGGRFTITAPVRAEDVWTLDIADNNKFYTVEWTPPDRFGVSSSSDDSAFGGGPDEVFSNVDDTFAHLVRFLTTTQRPSPPLPALLARVREERGVSQAELARRLGLAQATVSGYERRRDIQLSTLQKVVGALGGAVQISVVFDDATYTVAGEVSGERVGLMPTQTLRPTEPVRSSYSFPSLERKGHLAKAEDITAKVAHRPGGLLAA